MGDYSIIALRGNIGQEFLLRDDGVYVGELFTDQRMAPSMLPPTKDIVGLPINDNSLGSEPFNGWIARQQDGKVRMTYGLTDVRIAEVTGLEHIQSLPAQTLTLTETQIAQAKAFTPQKGEAQATSLEIARGGAFTLDAAQFAAGATTIHAGREEVGKALLRYDAQNLYIAWQVFDTTPLQNKGTFPPLAFKTGDSVNIYLAPDGATTGGTRLLLTLLQGKPVAMVYRPDGPGDKPYIFESPVRKSLCKYVAEESAITFQTQCNATDYLLSATIPWTVLGITPRAGMKLRGDLGILFGDDTGSLTARRVQWVDQETNVVNDVPTESEFSPARWGEFLLQ